MRKILILLCFTLSLFSCDDNEAIKSTINGTITASTAMGNMSVDSIMVVLIDADLKPDTVNFENGAAFIDTVYTNTAGSFVFNNIKAGNYYVIPIKEGYQISGTNTSGEDIIEITSNDVELLYTAEILLQAAKLKLHSVLSQYPEGTTRIRYKLYRQKYISFFPYWKFVNEGEMESNNTGEKAAVNEMNKGYNYGVVACTSNFKYVITLSHSKGKTSTKTFITDFGDYYHLSGEWYHYLYWEDEDYIQGY